MTISVKDATRCILEELSKETGKTPDEIIECAIRDYQAKQYWKVANEAWAKLRSDPAAWQEELDERRLWEATLKDGLEDD